MILYHLEKAKFQHIWPPEGTLFSEGRWNKPGQWLIYCSPTISLAKLEILANETRLVNDRVCMTIEIEEPVSTYLIDIQKLPTNWMIKPYPIQLHRHITDFLQSNKLICQVPSAQSYRESNYLINVRHADFHKVVKLVDARAEPFDGRLKE